MNKIIFYETFQNNYNKNEPIKILLNSYDQYLSSLDNGSKYDFNTCVITEYDKKFIKDNSFFSTLLKKKPIFNNNYLSVYDCEKIY